MDTRNIAGLLDDIHVDIVVVLLGSGVRLFDHLAGTPAVLGNPTVIPGVGVTHLRYPVRKAFHSPAALCDRAAPKVRAIDCGGLTSGILS